MHRIHYAGDSVLTGSEIAHALLQYAELLAKAGTAGMFDIPTREDDGSVGSSTILIGPASQLIADAEESEHEELVDEVVVRRLERLTAGLRHPPGPSATMTQGPGADVYDDL
ncbi:hypothetical protein ACFQ58_02855 [Agromyces sp. NPDC056523]|uniref:hypothetical protein n=1 Tax=Agromyces sp. NPDC056523 TaxID=3345850 RepID=UPI003672CE5A